MGLWSYSGADNAEVPKIIDKLTPAGKIDPAADHQQGLAALLPSLLQSSVANRRADSPLEAICV